MKSSFRRGLSICSLALIWALAAVADVQALRARIKALAADGVLDTSDVTAILGEVGPLVNSSSAALIQNAIVNGKYEEAGQPTLNFKVPGEALQAAQSLSVARGLSASEIKQIKSEMSFGGNAVPDAVKQVLAQARLAGAVAYDVNEQDSKGKNIWDPHVTSSYPTGNMAFSYTEVTPQILEKIKKDTSDHRCQTGTIPDIDPSTGKPYHDPDTGQALMKATYSTCKATPGIQAEFDEASHEDVWALGSVGQRWVNNCGILSDGSLHCVPASRRWSEDPSYTLVDPDVAGGKHLLFHGHFDLDSAGVVIGVEMSGRISKLAGGGNAVFVDPIAILKAWDFKLRDGLQIVWGNTSSGTPVVDEATHTIHNSGFP